MLVEQQMPISSSWNKSGAEPAEAGTYQGATDQDRSLHPLLLPDLEGRNASEHSAHWMLDSELHVSFLLGTHEWHWLAGIVALLEQRARLQRWRQSTVASPRSASRRALMLGHQTRSLPRSSRIWRAGGGRARSELGQECEQQGVKCNVSHF